MAQTSKASVPGDETGPVVVTPQHDISPSAPVPNYPVDASTGLPLSVIQTGTCPENSLGSTALRPLGAEYYPDGGNSDQQEVMRGSTNASTEQGDGDAMKDPGSGSDLPAPESKDQL